MANELIAKSQTLPSLPDNDLFARFLSAMGLLMHAHKKEWRSHTYTLRAVVGLVEDMIMPSRSRELFYTIDGPQGSELRRFSDFELGVSSTDILSQNGWHFVPSNDKEELRRRASQREHFKEYIFDVRKRYSHNRPVLDALDIAEAVAENSLEIRQAITQRLLQEERPIESAEELNHQLEERLGYPNTVFIRGPHTSAIEEKLVAFKEAFTSIGSRSTVKKNGEIPLLAPL